MRDLHDSKAVHVVRRADHVSVSVSAHVNVYDHVYVYVYVYDDVGFEGALGIKDLTS